MYPVSHNLLTTRYSTYFTKVCSLLKNWFPCGVNGGRQVDVPKFPQCILQICYCFYPICMSTWRLYWRSSKWNMFKTYKNVTVSLHTFKEYILSLFICVAIPDIKIYKNHHKMNSRFHVNYLYKYMNTRSLKCTGASSDTIKSIKEDGSNWSHYILCFFYLQLYCLSSFFHC